MSVGSSKIDIIQLLSACSDVAERAGVILHEVVERGDHKRFLEKTGPTDLVTVADGQAQALIVGTLLKYFPTLRIVGEESIAPSITVDDASLTKLESHRSRFIAKGLPVEHDVESLVVYVDPLDGTKEYTDGIYEAVTILIGIAKAGVPLAGVVFEPWGGADQKGNLVWGYVGLGAEGISPSVPKAFDDIRVCTTRSHNNPLVDEAVTKLGIPPFRVIRAGGCGRKVMMVSRNEAECYLYPTAGTNKWDTCAPEAILRAAGGVLTDKYGQPIDYNHGTHLPNLDGVIATVNADYHQRIMQLLNYKK